MVGMVGLSGSGKSTVANLLLRFYQPQEGRMVLRGRPMESWTVASTRRAMAWVSQEGALFDGTVAENLCYGVEGPTEESMRCAASWAEADGFIEALPDGYKTWIGEDGNRLSGGQRQRLALARALHQDRSLLILDEATSALDNLTEQSVQRAIERERRGRTTVIIAHRLSTLERVDRILVFEMGRVVEQGTHGELMALGGRYALMVERERQDDGSGEER
jgi:ABC-type multidrug transport system fused ATPase/permease subunit